MKNPDTGEQERFCPAALMPLHEAAKDNGGSVRSTADPFCHCEAGPQRMNIMIGNITLPISDPRAGRFICGKALEELE